MLIKHPRPQLGRQQAFGIEFVDGVARVDSLHPERELALAQHGYTIEAEGVPLESLSKGELVDLAQAADITVPAKATKAEIISAINASPSIPVLE